MDLIIIKILKQHPLVLQQKRLHLGQRHIQPLKLSLQKKNIQTSHATDMTTAESSKHYLR